MRILFFVSIIFFLVTGCSNQTGAELFNSQVKKELASGKRVDDIFFKIRFGMNQKEFYNYCWEMNKQGLFTDGKDPKGNMFVLYKLKNELKHPASLNFFPDFKQNIIVKMNAFYQYEGWAPWNHQLFSDSLLQDVLSLYKKQYPEGNAFIKIEDKNKGTQYAKIDGNRQIILSIVDDAIVKVEFTDLSVADDKK